MLGEIKGRMLSTIGGKPLSHQTLNDLEDQCLEALAPREDALDAGVCTSLFVVVRVCHSMKERLDQSVGDYTYHYRMTECLQPVLAHVIESIDASPKERLEVLDELVRIAISYPWPSQDEVSVAS